MTTFFKSWNKKSHWLQVSATKLLVEEMPNGFFGQNLQKGLKQYHHRIFRIQNGLGTKFQIKPTILNYWIKLTQKAYF